jgi:hypothetical protein
MGRPHASGRIAQESLDPRETVQSGRGQKKQQSFPKTEIHANVFLVAELTAAPLAAPARRNGTAERK